MSESAIQYYILGNTAVVKVSGKLYNLSTSDYRYPQFLEMLNKNDAEGVLRVLDPTLILGTEGFSVKDGILFYKDQALPTALGDRFLDLKVNKVSFLAVVNLWFNLKNRTDFNESREQVIEVLSNNGYPLTEDGFVVIFRSDSEVSNPLSQAQIRFCRYSSNSVYAHYFLAYRTLPEILEDVFGFCSKKLQKLALDSILGSSDGRMSEGFLNFGTAVRGLFSPNNLFALLEQDGFIRFSSVSPAEFERLKLVNHFLRKIATTKTGEVIEKKLMTLLMQAPSLGVLFDCAKTDKELEEKGVTIDYRNIANFSTIDHYHRYLFREKERLTHPEYQLEVAKHHPQVLEVKDQVVGNRKIVVPETNYDLVEWSRLMNNCISTYADRVKGGNTLVFAVVDKESERLLYNIEIQNKRISQFVGHSNISVHGPDVSAIREFLVEKGLIDAKTEAKA